MRRGRRGGEGAGCKSHLIFGPSPFFLQNACYVFWYVVIEELVWDGKKRCTSRPPPPPHPSPRLNKFFWSGAPEKVIIANNHACFEKLESVLFLGVSFSVGVTHSVQNNDVQPENVMILLSSIDI